jgi:hypothetical protein
LPEEEEEKNSDNHLCHGLMNGCSAFAEYQDGAPTLPQLCIV